ncbi:hypothetical protein UK23_21740 [Lentzea aerocolonigenes]|uniref:SCP domain-containing protein n=1 Tax=Lentzea aerocolonigenes TaxID=68170 RepID=A0A0F0GU40_LENAE|nr:hypothetical protein UK23_21740 [Lentzea aerocolonigenes]
MLSTINQYRARHGAPPVRLDSSVSQVAQDWANRLQSRGGPSQHRPNNQFGEDIFWGSGGGENPDGFSRHGIDAFYGEGRGYNYSQEWNGSNINQNHALHFTALVWRSTNRIGVGLAQGRNGSYLVVNFAPAGNVLGQFRANVLPPR